MTDDKEDRPWVKGEVEILRARRAKGEAFSEIGKRLSRSRRSCIGKAWRLGMCKPTPHLVGIAGRPLPEEEKHKRLRIAAAVADEGGRVRDVADRLDMDTSAVNRWLAENAGEIHALLKGHQSAKLFTPLPTAIHRLRVVRDRSKAGVRKFKIAAELGITPSALANWLRRWARDSVEQALADLEPETVGELAA